MTVRPRRTAWGFGTTTDTASAPDGHRDPACRPREDGSTWQADAVNAVLDVLRVVLQIYFLLLIFRLVMEFVFQFSRSYEPRGPMLVVLEVTYTLTDPPLKLIRRFVPPLRLGGVAI